MKIYVTLLTNKGDIYCRTNPGIAIVDYADLFVENDNGRDDSFWKRIREHYNYYSQFDFCLDVKRQTKIEEIKEEISKRIGFDRNRLKKKHIPICIFANGMLTWIHDTLIDVGKLSKYYDFNNEMHIFLAFNDQAGDIWREEGLRYYMNSRERGSHHEPHVHVDYKHEADASISIKNGKVLDGKLPTKVQRKAQEKILNNQQFLMQCWNKLTDGLYVDINHYFGIKPLEI